MREQAFVMTMDCEDFAEPPAHSVAETSSYFSERSASLGERVGGRTLWGIFLFCVLSKPNHAWLGVQEESASRF